MKLPPEYDPHDWNTEGGKKGPNWPMILILAAYIAFFTWLIVR